MSTTTVFEYRQGNPDGNGRNNAIVSGFATIDNGETATLAIPNHGRSVVRLGLPTLTGTALTFTVQPFPPADPAAPTLDPPFRTLRDRDGNTVTVTVSGAGVVEVPQLSGCYAFTIVSNAAEGSARRIEVQMVGANPAPFEEAPSAYTTAAGAYQVEDGTWRQPNGSVLSNSSTAGTFFVQGMPTQRFFRGVDAQGNTKTDVMHGWFQLPVGYVSGSAVTLRIAVGLAGSGTAGTCTIDAEVRKQAVDASVGGDLVTTAATAISGTFGNKDFTVTPTGLVAGDVFTITLTTAVQETGGIATLVALVTNIEIRPVVRQFA